MEAKDLLFTPIYLVIIYAIAYIIRPKLTDKVTHKYFMPALTLKIVGAIALGLIYQYYYQYGDTLRYHFFSEVISNLLIEKPALGIKILFSEYNTSDSLISYYLNDNYFFRREGGGFLILKICGIIGVICQRSYYTIAVVFAFIGFIGGWYLFKTFYEAYPKLHKKLFLITLCIPSIVLWGSGILKDTITLSCLGILTYAIYKLFIVKRLRLVYILTASMAIYFILILKIYILLCFFPSVLLWVFSHKIASIKNVALKFLMTPVVLILLSVVAYFVIQGISSYDSRYSLENLEKTVHVTSDWITYTSGTSGSFYSLGDDFELSLAGVLSKLPAGINVTLFRPYIWEVNNIVMLIASLESLLLLLFTMYVLYKTGVTTFFKIISQHAITKFLFVFSLSFAFAVGISTYNFGTLVRYKIPCIPFYLALLIIVLHLHKERKRINNSHN